MKKILLSFSALLSLMLVFSACGADDDNTSIGGSPGASGSCEDSPEWSISSCQVFDGGPGKDGIPSVDDPQFMLASNVTFLDDNDLVVGITINGETKAYPHPIMDWHEIVNDEVGDTPVAITYCPLTGTASAWDRTIDGEVTTFGVSGLLFNTNLIPYDRKTDSNWSQMFLKSVNGNLIEQDIVTHQLIETEWSTWKAMFPDSEVLTTDTGFERDYDRYPYGDYRTNDNFLIFPISNEDGRFDRKDRGLGVIVNGQEKFFSLNSFTGDVVNIQEESFAGVELVVAGSRDLNFVVAYERTLDDGTILSFSPVNPQSGSVPEAILQDTEGNLWNLLGVAVEGPRVGTQLKAPESFIGYWFAWAAFYPDLEIF